MAAASTGVLRRVSSLFRLKNAVMSNRILDGHFNPRILYHRSHILLKAKGEQIKMPSLSPTMTEGTLVRWLKQEGDTISPGDVLCEIQTDKAVVGFEVEEEGVLAKILVPDDSKDVKIGTVIGVMVESGEDWKDVEFPTASASVPDQPAAQTGGTVQGMDIKMPSLSPTMTEGTIVKWLKGEGDTISPGDTVCEIQTDKAIVGFETEEEGILAKILVPENTKDVKLGTVIAIMVQEGEDWKNVAVGPTVVPSEKDAAPVDQKGKVSMPEVTEQPSTARKMYGPSVRNLLDEFGLKYSVVTPTGPHNIILKGDVLKYIDVNNIQRESVKKEKEAVVSAPDITYIEEQEYVDIPHTSMRKTIARRLTESKSTIPHAYMKIDCTANDIIRLRSKMKSQGIAVSVNDFVIKCAALALKKVPEVNVVWDKDKSRVAETVDISVAVATDTGLITPIVKHADLLGVQEISECVKELAGRARQGKLKPEEFQGGTFSISNLGMFGIAEFTAVINPPQSAILAVGTSRLVFTGADRPDTKMTVQLSYDRRVIDDSSAAQFLECFRQYIEDPVMISFDTVVKSHGEGS